MRHTKPRNCRRLYRNRNRIICAYPFTEGGGLVARNLGYTGRELDAKIEGAPLWSVGPDGLEMLFDGVNDRLRCSSPEIGVQQGRELDIYLNDGGGTGGSVYRHNIGFSCRMRFRTTDSTALTRMIGKVGNGSGFIVNFNFPTAGKLTFYVQSFAGAENLESSGTPALNDGRLHEMWLVHDRRVPGITNHRYNIYLDGRLDATRLGVADGPLVDGFDFMVGAHDFGFWIGRMSLCEVWNCIISPREVASYWADGWQDYRAPLRKAWKAGAAPVGGFGDVYSQALLRPT